MTEATTTVSSDAAVSADMNTAAASTTPTTDVEVKLGDKSVKVSPDVAAALQAAQKAAEDAGQNVAKLTEQVTQMQAAIEAAKPKAKGTGEVGMDVLLFTDPDAAVEKITQNIIAKVSAESQKEKNQQQFWDEFYKQNKELKDHDDYVKYVFQREFNVMTGKKMTNADAIKHVGEAAKADILKLRGKGGNSKPIAEGGNEPGTRSGGGQSDDVSEGSPTTTAAILAERAAARRAAKQPGRKAK